MQPLVSIYLPTHNRADLLVRSVRSVLAQSYKKIELLIVDDGSTDNTPNVIQHLAESDSRIRALRQPEARGAPAARNLAIREATGKLVTGIDDDDEMMPERIAALVSAFDDKYSLVCSGFIRKTKAGSRTLANSRMIITLDDQLMRNHVGNAALSTRDRLLEVDSFDETMPAWQDYDLWTRLIAHFGVALRIPTVDHIVHLDHDSPRISNRTLLGAERFLEKHRKLMSDAHLKSQELERFMLQDRCMALADLIRLGTPGNLRRASRYFVTSNAKWLRKIRADLQ